MGEKKKNVHRALYRKYRSKSLSEVIGQEHITTTLQHAIEQGKISHAYLFTGPRGVGKTSVARILAHEVNALPYTDDATDLDIIEIDAASNRRIDDIRDLREKITIAPLKTTYKVYIIDEVHMLTPESFNALLKTLEEPPAHVIFILATTEVHKLPATIISRTQHHSFKTIPAKQVAAHLKVIAKKESITITDGALMLLAEHGGGSFRDSISLLDQLSSSNEPITEELVALILGLAPQITLQKLVEAIESGDIKELFQLLEKLYEVGLTPTAIAMQLIALLRQHVQQTGQTNHVLLMKQLLEVNGSVYPMPKLETVLIEAATQGTATVAHTKSTDTLKSKNIQQKVQDTSQKTIPTSVTTATKKMSSPPEEEKTATVDSANLDQPIALEESWPAILEAVKQQNNSLYTVLRLAQPQLTTKQLLLTFGFSFHQKRATTTTNKQLLTQIIHKLTGESVTIAARVVKQETPKSSVEDMTYRLPPTDTDPAHASLIAQVQDMMGGGEIVNV